MACRLQNILDGYDESRFQGGVRQDLLCSICLKVLNDPKTCQNKEHAFCSGCITEHLRRSSTCPECREHLTPDTLKNPPRFLLNTLSDLKINCKYNDRGCPEYVRLENLQNHADQCGYSPAMCRNEGCTMVVNKRDKEIHEKHFCQFRIVKCHDCRDIKASVDGLKERQDQMKAAQDEMKQKLNETIVKIDGVERKQGQIDNKVSTIKENVDEIQQTQAEMKQEYEKICEMIRKLLQATNVANDRAQALDPATPVGSTINRDIIIVGGRCGVEKDKMITDTVEKLNVLEGISVQLPSMNQQRLESASCVYNNDVIVAGGYDGQAGTDTMEILEMKQHPLTWRMLDGKLPVKLSGHAVALYLGNIFIIGGFDWNEKKTSDAIFEVRLIPSCKSKLLVRMPYTIRNHRAEIVNDKLFILGGTKTRYDKDATDSVVLYDPSKKKFTSFPSLPRPVFGMSTVTWGNMIIVVGGSDENAQPLNDVIMYDTETGQSKKLPSMIYKRNGCSAVIMNDVIVVMGGWNKEHGCLKSVETLNIGSDGWKELTGMMEKRKSASAVVKPVN